MVETSKPSDEQVTEAWVYLLGRYLVMRQEAIDLAEKGAGYNVLKHNPAVVIGWGAGSAPTFVNPNLDVVYSEAWVAVDETVDGRAGRLHAGAGGGPVCRARRRKPQEPAAGGVRRVGHRVVGAAAAPPPSSPPRWCSPWSGALRSPLTGPSTSPWATGRVPLSRVCVPSWCTTTPQLWPCCS